MAINRKQPKAPVETSRLFAKNLPDKYTVEQVKALFAKHGTVTDCKLLKDKNGKSRRIAYVGFKSIQDASGALKKLNGATIGIAKLSVERCKELKQILTDPKRSKNKKDFLTDKIDPDLVDSDEGEGDDQDDKLAKIADSGRLFVRNLSYVTTETDLKEAFKVYGQLTELILPLDEETEKSKGFAFVEYAMPEHAVAALNGLDGTVFMGRLMHILPGEEKIVKSKAPIRFESSANTSYKKEKLAKMRETASTDTHSWNSLFVGSNAVANEIAKRYDVSKMDLLKRDDAAVQLALGESQVVNDIKDYLINHGVKLDTFTKGQKRSDKIILVKNLPSGALPSELRAKFEPFGALGRIVMPPSGLAALVEYYGSINAKKAFTACAYARFVDRPLYLEWAPVGCLADEEKKPKKENFNEPKIEPKIEIKSEPTKNEGPTGTTLFVKNLSFKSDEEKLQILFHRFNPTNVQISRRLEKGKYLSMGYGFITVDSQRIALEIIKTLQGVELDGHRLELKISNRKGSETLGTQRKEAKNQIQPENSAKLIVRNVPFQCTADEIRSLFSTFGQVKNARTPKKHSGQHRGFCFVEMGTSSEARAAFDSLKLSTHMYGRRLVIEWADTDVNSVQRIREKTAENYRGKKRRFEMPNEGGEEQSNMDVNDD